MNKIIIYQSDDQQAQVEVRFKDETVWLNQDHLSLLFQRDQSVISRHINNIFKEGELEPESNMQKMHIAHSDKPVVYYNLDVIISVGYRVKSKRGTQFRQWATKRLKEYLVDGYAINQKRLEERNLELQHLKTGIAILRRAIAHQAKNLDEAENLADLLERFSGGLSLLDDYDRETLDTTGKTKRKAVIIEACDYQNLIDAMRGEFASELFGKQKDTGFESSIRQIYQSFGGTEMYPSVEEKAAMLLYLIVKNHSFIDGNKRIAAACFLYFLEKNGLLYHKNGETIISNEALASLTLFIAVSKPEEMQTVKQVAVSILNRIDISCPSV
ncbi:MAG: death-on-curing protein [Desulfobacteraceae bacterium]|nr:MAG: death-on-curing protein [Desulfobacteraceae bacterium]